MTEKFAVDGALLVPRVFSTDEVEVLVAKLPDLGSAAGNRELLQQSWCRDLALDARMMELVESALGAPGVARRAILFDKTAEVNWVLGYHQDLKIAVKEQAEVEGYSAWSTKNGVVHCQPPEAILKSCVALRIHLDDCPASNGPLRVKAGSHRFGVLAEAPQECEERVMTAWRGDVLMMHPLTWHASSKSEAVGHRRVIHIEYSSADLPHPLRWAYGELANSVF